MKKKYLLFGLYLLFEIVLLYCLMSYAGYEDFSFRWNTLAWALGTTIVSCFIFWPTKRTLWIFRKNRR